MMIIANTMSFISQPMKLIQTFLIVQTVIIGSLGLVISQGCVMLSASHTTEPSGEVLYQMGAIYPEYSNIPLELWSQYASDPQPSVDKVYALLVLNRSGEALGAARQVLAHNPGDLDGFEALVCVLYYRKNLALLNYHARHVLSQDPQRTQMWNILGLAHVYTARSQADFRRAESYFQKALSQPQSAGVAYLNLGFMHLEMGAIDRAMTSFSQAEETCDGCAPAKLGLGISLRRQNRFKEAEMHFRSALKIKMPKKTRLKFYFHLALTLSENPETKSDAIDLLTKIVSELDGSDELYVKSQAVINELTLDKTAL